jgi:hypothetical protein
MYDEPVGSDLCADVDVRIVFPDNGVIRIKSTRLFAEPDGSLCRRFVGRVFLVPEIDTRWGPASRGLRLRRLVFRRGRFTPVEG